MSKYGLALFTKDGTIWLDMPYHRYIECVKVAKHYVKSDLELNYVGVCGYNKGKIEQISFISRGENGEPLWFVGHGEMSYKDFE